MLPVGHMFDPAGSVDNNNQIVVKEEARILSISKKEFTKCIKIASMR
jgi:hypothetical protein